MMIMMSIWCLWNRWPMSILAEWDNLSGGIHFINYLFVVRNASECSTRKKPMSLKWSTSPQKSKSVFPSVFLSLSCSNIWRPMKKNQLSTRWRKSISLRIPM
jgi:hypothetical protein